MCTRKNGSHGRDQIAGLMSEHGHGSCADQGHARNDQTVLDQALAFFVLRNLRMLFPFRYGKRVTKTILPPDQRIRVTSAGVCGGDEQSAHGDSVSESLHSA